MYAARVDVSADSLARLTSIFRPSERRGLSPPSGLCDARNGGSQTAGINPAARYETDQIAKEPTPYFPLIQRRFQAVFGRQTHSRDQRLSRYPRKERQSTCRQIGSECRIKLLVSFWQSLESFLEVAGRRKSSAVIHCKRLVYNRLRRTLYKSSPPSARPLLFLATTSFDRQNHMPFNDLQSNRSTQRERLPPSRTHTRSTHSYGQG